MKTQKELTCIGCPLGCQLSIELEDGAILSISGHSCPRGQAYAEKELIHPERALSSTVPVAGSVLHMLPVRTVREIPKEKISAGMAEIRQLHLQAPVPAGTVLIQDLAGTGVPLIAARDADCA